jgi:hypothetical protein
MKPMLRVPRAAAVLATILVATATGGAMVALGDAEDAPAQSPAMRVRIAAQAAESALGLVKPAQGWIRLPTVPLRDRRLIGSRAVESGNLSHEERAKLKAHATLWVTSSTPRAILAYVRSRLPHDAKAQGESTVGTSPRPVGPPGPNTLSEIRRHEKVEFWSQEFTLPPASDVLRSRALTVYIARATGGRFVIRLEGRAVWEGVRPSYSLLGTNVHVITITNTFPAKRSVGPSSAIISNPSLVQELVALVNSIPVFEDKGAAFSCPSEKPEATSETETPEATSESNFVLTFAEQPSAAPLATLEGQPYACGESFLPIISVAGHPSLELGVEPALVRMINRDAGLHLPQG